MNMEYPRPPRSRGIYLLPNLFTVSALFFGFYAVIAAIKGNFEHACIAVFIAMIMDALDGRVARLTHTQTAFGAELDSLSDMVSFGVAPAVIAYTWGLSDLGKAGWLVAFIYTTAVALRLARFNVETSVADKRYFKGLPSPAAAWVAVSLIWSLHQYDLSTFGTKIVTAVIMVLVGGFMVSNIPYYSFKSFDFKNKIPYVALLVIVLVFVLVSADPPLVLFLVSLSFAGYAPILWLIRRFPRRLRCWRRGKKEP
ncbi:MAG: CDP-diacylglycerol--serine O-phosphatidyltransferase [Gammaproteobacteria bacterium]|jgi:CDP-diacylglycerol--serine O-phosphatidyltransferase|nr:CDP-diacylglycerol--serine O-phosphatidyltransferase [Gammaproteobacteria bacterium]